MDGLRDRPRSEKPSDISKEETDKIRKELSDSNTGWDIKQVIDLIQKRGGLESTTTRNIFEGCFTSGAFHLKYPRKDL